VCDNESVSAWGSDKVSAITWAQFDVADHCSFWNPAQRLYVSSLSGRLASNFDLLANKHAFRRRDVNIVAAIDYKSRQWSTPRHFVEQISDPARRMAIDRIVSCWM
jgi:hypothetical protein